MHLAEQLGETSLDPYVASELRSKQAGHLGLACSGGADSVGMVLMVWACFPQFRQRMTVLHFNHATRGDAADEDDQFVREMSADLALNFKAGRREAAKTVVSEDELRRARMSFFQDSGCDCVVTGHHLNDVAETMWMRLMRGSGLDGLAAPRPISDSGYTFRLLRPLLNIKRVTLEKALKACEIPWRKDASNAAPTYLRNRVRAALIPMLNALNERDSVQAAGRTRRLLQEDADALNKLAGALFERAHTPRGLHWETLQGQSKALWRRVLHLWLTQQPAVSISAESFEQLLERWILGKTFRQSAGRSCFFQWDAGYLQLALVEPDTTWRAFWAEPDNQYPLPNAKVMGVERVQLDDHLRGRILSGNVNPEHEAYVAAENDTLHRVWIRPWQQGDKLRPLGAPGKRKLQDIFVDKKIVVEERSIRPMVCMNAQDILWCPGIPPSETHKITPTSNWALRLTYLSSS